MHGSSHNQHSAAEEQIQNQAVQYMRESNTQLISDAGASRTMDLLKLQAHV